MKDNVALTQKLVPACSIWRALEVVGDTPTLLIIQSYWLGARRFEEFRKQTGLLKALVSNRLKKLVEEGCFKKVVYSDRPLRSEYVGTEKLRDQYKLSLAMLNWERKWFDGTNENKVHIELRHKNCGKVTDPVPVCSCCRSNVKARETDWRLGPGGGEMVAEYGRRRQDAFNKGRPHTALFDNFSYVIGDRWRSLIIRSIFRNLNKYDEILGDTQMATNILTDRLKSLCEEGFLKKEQYQSNPRRFSYKLTDKGLDVYPVMMLIMEWGDKWYPDPKGPPLLLTHRPCNHPLQIDMACSACGESVDLGDLDYQILEETEGAAVNMLTPAAV